MSETKVTIMPIMPFGRADNLAYQSKNALASSKQSYETIKTTIESEPICVLSHVFEHSNLEQILDLGKKAQISILVTTGEELSAYRSKLESAKQCGFKIIGLIDRPKNMINEGSLRHIKEGFLKPNVYAPKGTTLKLPDNESLCCTPRPDRG